MGREMQPQMDHILGIYIRLFRNMSVQDPRQSSDNNMILGCLHSTTLRENTKYLGRRTRIPLHPPNTPTREYGIFATLRREIPKTKAWEARKNA